MANRFFYVFLKKISRSGWKNRRFLIIFFSFFRVFDRFLGPWKIIFVSRALARGVFGSPSGSVLHFWALFSFVNYLVIGKTLENENLEFCKRSQKKAKKGVKRPWVFLSNTSKIGVFHLFFSDFWRFVRGVSFFSPKKVAFFDTGNIEKRLFLRVSIQGA